MKGGRREAGEEGGEDTEEECLDRRSALARVRVVRRGA